MQQVVTLTVNPAVDKSCSVETMAAERKLSCHSVRYEPGGGGINVSRAMHKLGGHSTAVYPAGGTTGTLLKNLLDREQVEHRPVEIEGMSRQNLIVSEESSDRQFRLGMPGPEMADREWRKCLEAVDSVSHADILVASGSLPPGVPDDFYEQVARLCKERSVKLVLDTRGKPLQMAVCAGAYLLKPNMRELRELSGEELDSERRQEEYGRELVEGGCCDVLVLSLGAAGVLVVSAQGTERIRAPAVTIRSKVGAGDSMVAGIVLGLSQGMEIGRAIRLGVAAGASAVSTPGSELCRRDSTEELFEAMTD